MVLASQSQDGVIQSRERVAGTQDFRPIGPEYLILELFAIEEGVNRVQMVEVG
jgi:hypothetical protein